ncbi:class I SAM-dependent methyltransferase [Arhodomonas sp. SL1]|uniref:class I SAM-dependent methyltransferase n=1 Tax=Arhodomonas sp. SL1 TaxID=3425691 RepID=UPI003F8846A6
MSNRTIGIDPRLLDYLISEGVRENAVQRTLREDTAGMPYAGMQIAPEEGALLAMLVRLTGASRIIEVGTFTGYSALTMALALPEHGRLIACDNNREWTDMARRYWEAAGVGERIELRLGEARDTLDGLLEEGDAGGFDLMFIDADKQGYPDYYERGLALLRPGGLVAVDNTLWHGRVVDPDAQDEATQAIRAFNHSLRDDERVDLCLVPVADGLTLARKR